MASLSSQHKPSIGSSCAAEPVARSRRLRGLCCRRHDGTALLRWRDRFRKSAPADQPRFLCGRTDFERRRARAARLCEAVLVAGRQASEAGAIQPEKGLGVPGVNRRCDPPHSYEQRE